MKRIEMYKLHKLFKTWNNVKKGNNNSFLPNWFWAKAIKLDNSDNMTREGDIRMQKKIWNWRELNKRGTIESKSKLKNLDEDTKLQ